MVFVQTFDLQCNVDLIFLFGGFNGASAKWAASEQTDWGWQWLKVVSADKTVSSSRTFCSKERNVTPTHSQSYVNAQNLLES